MPRVVLTAGQVVNLHAYQLDRLAQILANRGERRAKRGIAWYPSCVCHMRHDPQPPDPPLPEGLAEACSSLLDARASGDRTREEIAHQLLWNLIGGAVSRVV